MHIQFPHAYYLHLPRPDAILGPPLLAHYRHYCVLLDLASVMLSWMSIYNYSEHCKPALLSENIGVLAPHSVLPSQGVWPLKS